MPEPTPPAALHVPSCYVDAVQATRQPFTVQVLLGSLDMGGQVAPAVHLTMSPGFCKYLGELLLSAATAEAERKSDGGK